MVLLILRGGTAAGAAVDWTVYLRRAGPARIGMSISDVRRVLGDQQASLAFTGPEPDDAECAYLQSRALPRHLGLMFQKGRLVRIDVRAPGIRTASGAAVGDAEDRIKRIYDGRISVGPHPYLDKNGHYLTYLPVGDEDGEYGMVFETRDGRVTSFRTGTRDAVALKEGCS